MAIGSCGVYAIINRRTGKMYIGSTKNRFSIRFSTHRQLLNRNKHFNIHLQRSWNKHGPEGFLFKVLEICHPEKQIEREQFHLDKYEAYTKGYNRCPIAGRPPCGIEISDETRSKMSKTHTGMKHTEESKRKISEAHLGREFTEEHRKNIGKSRPGYMHSEETKAKISAFVSSPEFKEKISKANKGRKHDEKARKLMSEKGKGRAKSEEHKAKIKTALKAFHSRKGKLNGQ